MAEEGSVWKTRILPLGIQCLICRAQGQPATKRSEQSTDVSFPAAAVADHDKLSGFKCNTNLPQLWTSEARLWLTGPKSQCWHSCFLLEALGKHPFPCLFQLLEAARIPWLVALLPSSNSASAGHVFLKLHSSDLLLLKCLFFLKFV